MRIAFTTLGCKVNHYETQAMRELFAQAGWEIVGFSEPAEVYVVNTCTVTQVSDKKSRQLLSQAHRRAPGALIVAVGCYAETAAGAVDGLPGVGLVLGTDGRREIVRRVTDALAGKRQEREAGARKSRAFEELSAIADSRTRATLKIQDGCDNFCAYCIIPYARGPIRSRSMESMERELLRLAAQGFSEVVLTGIHLASYGRDIPPDAAGRRPDLLDALRLANGIPGLSRIRLGSLEPKFCDERFAAAVAGMPGVCRQFHLSLQSGSDTVLRRMNRRYTAEEYRQAVAALRDAMPDCAITTDVIAGFVGETEAEHAETLAFVRQIGFARMHVFPYSRRKGTRADGMAGHLTRAVKEARAQELIRAGEAMERSFIDRQIGTVQEVLLEDGGTGYTGNYVRVRCPGQEGETKRVRITGREDMTAIGEEIDKHG